MLLTFLLTLLVFFYYREAETVDPRSGHGNLSLKGIARRALPASGGKDAVGGGGE